MLRGRSRITRVALAITAVACFGWLLARLLSPAGTPVADFTLTDQNGRPFTLSSQRGSAVALFFGYAHCPDVCPTTLAALARAERKMPANQAFRVVFVTVDPHRDTPAVLKRYVRLFDPSFVGLTGTDAQLAPVYRAYRVYHQALPAHSAAGYLVAHSSAIFFISPKGRLRGTGDWSDTPAELATSLEKAMT